MREQLTKEQVNELTAQIVYLTTNKSNYLNAKLQNLIEGDSLNKMQVKAQFRNIVKSIESRIEYLTNRINGNETSKMEITKREMCEKVMGNSLR